tara:strand:+ start:48 stop:728 length:681 start_codon:yes stop_codon:yes gene_type:complete
MSSKRFSYALFDFDGVIVDSEPIRLDTYKKLFNDLYGIDIKIDKIKMVGRPESYNLKELLKENNLDFKKDTITFLKKKRSKILIDKAKKKLPVIKNINYIINSLSSLKIPMGIVTNSSLSYIQNAMRALKMNINDFYIVSGDSVSKPKPDPQGYMIAIEEMNLSKDHGLAFEDSKNGLEAIKSSSSSLSTAAVLSSYSKDDLDAEFYIKPELDLIEAKNLISLFGA